MFTKDFNMRAISPFSLELTVWALRRRKTNLVDRWDGSQYTRVIVFNNNPIKVSVACGGEVGGSVYVTLQSKKEITPQIQKNARLLLRKMLGVDKDLSDFYQLAKKDKYLKSLVEMFKGVKPPRFPSIFEALINSISCQQVTLDLGILLLNRLAENFGIKFIDSERVSYAFPRPQDLSVVSEEKIKKLGYSYQKSRAIIELSQLIVERKLVLSDMETLSNEEIITRLTEIRGIGRWSAEYALLRGFGRIDVLPGDDVGAQKNLMLLMQLDERPAYDQIKQLTKNWNPYAGLVYFHLLLDKLQKKGVI